MTAPELSPEEAAIVARFDVAPVPPEVVVERVAAAIYGVDPDMTFDGRPVPWDEIGEEWRKYHRDAAAAAIAAMQPSPAEEAVERVEALADRFDSYAETARGAGTDNASSRMKAMGDVWEDAAQDIRAALASPAIVPLDKGTGMGEGVQ